MPLLIAQLAILIAIVFVIGCVIGHIIRGRKASRKDEERTIISAALATPVPAKVEIEQADQAAADPVVTDTVDEAETTTPAQPVEVEAQKTPAIVPDAEPVIVTVQAEPIIELEDIGKPKLLEAPQLGKADDLTSVKGIGKAVEAMLNGLGVFHYSQIAKWGSDESLWIEREIGFAGRVRREAWVRQAEKLSDGKVKPAVKGAVKAKKDVKTSSRKRVSKK